MIEARGLTRVYGEYTAVRDMSFVIADGTICGFIGANGAGKTTTMNMLTGYIAPSSGTALINGRDILEETAEAKRSLGYLPEVPPLYPDLTTEEYLRFAAALKGLPRKAGNAEADAKMERLGLLDVRKKLIRNLSKGFRQRVGIAGALIGDPGVLILDEPMTGLDPLQIIEMRELIASLKGKQTVLLSSHILSEVAEICDRVLIISEGELLADRAWSEADRRAGREELEALFLALAGGKEAEKEEHA